MMNVVLPCLDQGKAVVAWVDVEEIGLEWPHQPVADVKPQYITIERKQGLEFVDGEHRMADVERTGAKPRDGATRLERLVGGLGAMESLEPRPDGIGKN